MVIRPFTSADYEVISAIASAARPDTSITGLRLREEDKTRRSHIKFGGFMAEVRGKGVGFIWHTQYADYYQSNKVVLFGTVLPDFRNQGIGSRLLSSLETQLLKIGVTEMQTQVTEGDTATVTFLQNRSFRTTWRRLEYRLNVREADLSTLKQLSSRLAKQGICVLTYSELDDTDKDEVLRTLSWQLEQDVPYGEPPIELELETFKRERLLPEAVLKDAFYIAVENGRYIGMSSLWNYTAYLETEFTGVLPDYRGRGVAALMKLMGIDYAGRHGFLQIRTTNDADNKAMRRLNGRLGFGGQSALLRLDKNLTPILGG